MNASFRSDPVEVAIAHASAGRLDDARSVLAQVLRGQPRHVRALCALGAIALRGGEVARAFELVGHAVAAAPEDAMANSALAVVYQAKGELDAAHRCLTRALDLDASIPDLHANLASLLMAMGEPGRAVEAQMHAVALAPDSATLRYNLGNILAATGERAGAEQAFREALRLDPGHAGALNNLAVLCKRDGRLTLAGTLLAEARLRQPSNPELMANEADLLLQQGRPEEAVEAIRRAVALNPVNPRLRAAFGAILLEIGRPAEAGRELAAAMRGDPKSPDIALTLSRLLRRQDNLDGAYIAAERAAALRPGAGPASAQAVELLLMRGRFAEAWSRLAAEAGQATAPFAEPDLQADLAGKTLRLVAMDSAAALFAARFIAGLAARGAVATVVCPPVLAPLLATARGVAAVRPAAALDLRALGADGVPTLILDTLPWRLRVDPEHPVVELPVFDLPPPAAADRAAAPARFGVWWEGDGPGRALADALGDLADVTILQSAPSSPGGTGVRDFLELAQRIRDLDVLIAPDGPVAHLAASLGVECWVLVSRDGSWYWPNGTQPSPWYPGCRSVRQALDGSWTEALEMVRTAIADRIDGVAPKEETAR